MVSRLSIGAAPRQVAGPLALAAVIAGACQSGGSTMTGLLAYRRNAVLEGEVWRLATGAWIHLSWPHLLLNLCGFALVLAMFAQSIRPWRQFGTLVVIAVLTCIVLFAGFAQVAWMVGLSGPLHGLFVFGAARLLCTPDPHPEQDWLRGSRFGWMLLAGLALKIGFELVFRTQEKQGPPGWLGGPVLIEAHLAGAIAGIGAYAAWRLISAQRAVAAQAGGSERE